MATTVAKGSLAIGGTASGTFQASAETDDFSVALTAGFAYQFDLQGQAGLSNLGFNLVPASGSTINSTSIGTGLQRINYTAASTGTYTLAVIGSVTGSYSITSAPADDYTNNNNTTGMLAIGGTTNGALQTNADTDDFSVTLTAGFAYQFDLQGQGGLVNPSFDLFPASGSTISSTSIGTGLRRINYTAATSGTYTLAVGGSTTGSYSITSAPADDYTNTSNTAGILAIGGTASGALQTIADTDDFHVTLTAGFAYQFDLQGQGSLINPGFDLIPASGSAIGSTSIGTGLRRINYTAVTSGT